MATKKYRRLTNREKQVNKEIRQGMIEKGILSPPKEKLNRKKFIEDVRTEWNESNLGFEGYVYIMEAVGYMMSHYDRNFKVDLEAVGAAKVLKLALRLQEFHEKIRKEGKTSYNCMELSEFVGDVFGA